ncbi:hypothetical protein [Cohnella zeiphila]|uniref:Neutral/alkaline non-lysosomal ceramidase N-terminal domain-containing protein n=1 Tax=Cohnella zeiphila TaxID=2761120 RepID=A0A7X0SQZ1_9BACL|nr:hypothetical protein [Cohnella zeiphila]MBB6734321.1 hypothetical protein [Cohnella zeiphila]
METELALGTCKMEITPNFPVPLAGFASRFGMDPAASASRPLRARIFAFASRDGGEERRSLLISADLIWWGSDRVPGLKRRIQERYGIDEAAILLHGTHTHSGPQTSGLFTSFLGEPDPVYLADLEERIVAGIGRAYDHLEPVRAERRIGRSALGINRRGLRKLPPVAGPADHELNVISYVLRGGQSKAVLVHYACHPVITNENRFSSEYVGVAMDAIEEQLGQGLVAGFLQGTCGDINPGDGQSVIRGTDERVVEIGRAFAEDVLRTLEQPGSALTGCQLRWRSESISLPLAALPDKADLESGLALPGVEGEWHRIQRSRWPSPEKAMPMEITLWRLAKEVSLLAMNAEVVVEYGLYIRRLSQGRILPVAYTNGMFGYVPTAEQLAEGGYESVESTRYFAMPSVFDPAVERVFKQALDRLIDEWP